MIWLILYIIFAILSFGRAKGELYEINEDSLELFPPYDTSEDIWYLTICFILGPAMFAINTIWYFTNNEKYFLKWSYKDLKQRYKDPRKEEY